MATITYTTANDLATHLLDFYVKEGPLSQTTQDKPLLRELTASMDDFSGGQTNVQGAAQGKYMSDSSTFYVGYTAADLLTFQQAQDSVPWFYPWKEMAASLDISWTELKQDGITVTDPQKTREHRNAEAIRKTTGILKSRLANYGESLSRARNIMLWSDGSQDAKAVPGITSILTDDPTVGTTGGIARSTNVNGLYWWQHRALVGSLPAGANTGPKIVSSAASQNLSQTLRREARQLSRYSGGTEKLILAGSAFLDALEIELQAKGLQTQSGFGNKSSTDIMMAPISMRGVGNIEYDPTLDALGRSKFCYFIDKKHIKLRPMESEWNKILGPVRPYDQLVFLKTVTDTAVLTCDMLNSSGVYEIA